MIIPSGSLRWLAGVLTCLALLGQSAQAQGYPSKPLRLVVGFTSGGLADVLARLLAPRMGEVLGQSVVVENRPGAGSAISVELVAKAAPDGYTLLLLSDSATLLPSVRIKLPYDMERDLAPVSLVASAPLLLTAHPSLQARDVKELLALARAQPGKLSFGSAGVGTGPHFAGETMNLLGKVNIVHVPYKGGAETAIANAAGQVDLSFASIPSVLPLIAAGKIKPIAVTSIRRASLLPQVPTMDRRPPAFE